MALNIIEIQKIGEYLTANGIRFLDVRVELINHLATEFENNTCYVLLIDFLNSKKNFITNFQKSLHKKRHWTYQKALFNTIFNFFKKLSYFLVLMMIGFAIYFTQLVLNDKTLKVIALMSLVIPQIIAFYWYYSPKGVYMKIHSAQYMFSIMSLPSLFLNTSYFWFNTFHFMWFWLLAIVFNITGLLVVYNCRLKTINLYNELHING